MAIGFNYYFMHLFQLDSLFLFHVGQDFARRTGFMMNKIYVKLDRNHSRITVTMIIREENQLEDGINNL